MNLRQLEIFRAVMRCQTTMGAAATLSMSQPAVSNALKQMESQIGFPLFERINNRLFPTDAARMIYEDSEPLFAIHAALEMRVRDLRDDKVSRLRILATPPLGHGVVAQTMVHFAASHPHVRVGFDVRPLKDVIEGVESGAADIGFGLALGDAPTLKVQSLHAGAMVCVCRPDHRLAREHIVTPQMLRNQSFVGLDGETRMGQTVREAFAAEGVPYVAGVEVRYCGTACVLAAAGLGAAVVDPFSPAASGQTGLVVIPFAPRTPCPASVFWPGLRRQPVAASRFLEALHGTLARTVPTLVGQAAA
ncbi:transcriptional regulator [Azorhizobium oxalatiphilum]|uniref:Transcriptional regulator n=1 Tax=Azorhizobium oxalatiphilum TaxID=980631 RepID=A0A917BTG8_9HYPH|nr:LysR family transcriptional regulator [Azorhizobium oxalatiphilum]GGF55325.1 transcriptional regulator [Azorhizobium oxalatiphilum]